VKDNLISPFPGTKVDGPFLLQICFHSSFGALLIVKATGYSNSPNKSLLLPESKSYILISTTSYSGFVGYKTNSSFHIGLRVFLMVLVLTEVDCPLILSSQ
jgi:hypothetical protein